MPSERQCETHRQEFREKCERGQAAVYDRIVMWVVLFITSLGAVVGSFAVYGSTLSDRIGQVDKQAAVNRRMIESFRDGQQETVKKLDAILLRLPQP